MLIDYAKFANKIIAYRGTKTESGLISKIGLRDMAKYIGISASTLSRIERGSMPDLETYAKICKFLCVPMDEFLIK